MYFFKKYTKISVGVNTTPTATGANPLNLAFGVIKRREALVTRLETTAFDAKMSRGTNLSPQIKPRTRDRESPGGGKTDTEYRGDQVQRQGATNAPSFPGEAALQQGARDQNAKSTGNAITMIVLS